MAPGEDVGGELAVPAEQGDGAGECDAAFSRTPET